MKKIFAECIGVMKSKVKSYSGLKDAFGNFKRIAIKRDVPVALVWSIYFEKHLDALNSYLNGQYDDSEPIEGRLLDLVNYIFLLYGILAEEKILKYGLTKRKKE